MTLILFVSTIKRLRKFFKNMLVFHMSYRMEQLVLWEITATSLDTIILHQNTAGVFIVF